MKTKATPGPVTEPHLRVSNFAHIAKVDIAFGDLTVVVGPQGAGKSLILQWLKCALDGSQVTRALREAGHRLDRADLVIDLIFGSGMGRAWQHDASEILFNGKRVSPQSMARQGKSDGEKLFFIPAHRSMLISDGWATPFQKLTADTPVVARLFSQALYERFTDRYDGSLFPMNKRLKKAVRDKIDDAIFHGGQVRIEEDANHARRLRLVHGDVHLPFMTWTAGQREFTPLLLGLYHLLPSTKVRKREGTDWVVIEEPEMGLHPQAITAVMLLVLDLIWRGYRVVLSTHSPHVMATLWMMRSLQEHNAKRRLVAQAFDVKGNALDQVASAALSKVYRSFYLGFDADGKVRSRDISTLDAGADDDVVAGWGGLTEYTSRFGEVVRQSVNGSVL